MTNVLTVDDAALDQVVSLLTSARARNLMARVQELGSIIPSALPVSQLYADNLGPPTNASFALNSLAPAMKSLNFANVTVRAHDNAVDMGTYFEIETPATAASMSILALSAPDGAGGGTVTPLLQVFPIPCGVAPGPYSAGVELDDIVFPANTNPQCVDTTKTIGDWGLTAGEISQWEISRQAPDTLASSWDLIAYIIRWSTT